MKKNITLVGFGLLAGSIAAALKQAKQDVCINAVSSSATLENVKRLNLADNFFEYAEIEKWLPCSDLVLLCSPIKHILSVIEQLSKHSHLISKQVIVSDIGSTKGEICKKGFELPAPFYFVGGHPMAGSEKRSAEHSDPAMFENAYWLYCLPSKGKEQQSLPPILADLFDFLGARAVKISPIKHDKAMAWLSHAPQLVSSSIAAGIPEEVEEAFLYLSGRGFRDITRIAASSWNMWQDILQTNPHVLEVLNAYIRSMKKTSKALKVLAKSETDDMRDIFLQGNKVRNTIETGRNHAYPLSEIVVEISDEPGSILNTLLPLAEAKVNIRDIELMKVREGIGGTLILFFKSQDDADSAVKILERLGFVVRKRT